VDNHHGADAVCRKFGYNFGGAVHDSGIISGVNAMPVGTCMEGEDLASCTGGQNDFGNAEGGEGGRCSASGPVGVQVTCNHQCTTLENYSEATFQTCHPYLTNTTTYYIAVRPLNRPPSSPLRVHVVRICGISKLCGRQ
jgi:hypothetical protein